MAASTNFGIEAVKMAGLDPNVLTQGISTIFVPSDQAVASYVSSNPNAEAGLSSTTGTAAVGAHVVPNAALTTTEMKEGPATYTTSAGTPLVINKSGDAVVVSSGLSTANVIQSNLPAGNCIIHIIDNILAPVA